MKWWSQQGVRGSKCHKPFHYPTILARPSYNGTNALSIQIILEAFCLAQLVSFSTLKWYRFHAESVPLFFGHTLKCHQFLLLSSVRCDIKAKFVNIQSKKSQIIIVKKKGLNIYLKCRSQCEENKNKMPNNIVMKLVEFDNNIVLADKK